MSPARVVACDLVNRSALSRLMTTIPLNAGARISGAYYTTPSTSIASNAPYPGFASSLS
jgi:hypothetical protein